jgi:hypothetical protein
MTITLGFNFSQTLLEPIHHFKMAFCNNVWVIGQRSILKIKKIYAQSCCLQAAHVANLD